MFGFNPLLLDWPSGLPAASFASDKNGADAGEQGREEDLFGLDGIPEPDQLGEDRRALPRGDAEGAELPEDGGLGLPPDDLLHAARPDRPFRMLNERPGAATLPPESPTDSEPKSSYAVPEFAEEEPHRVETPKKLHALDYALAVLFALAGFILVVSTYRGIGFTWDEAYYYRPARKTLDWFGSILRPGEKAFGRPAIEEAFGAGSAISALPAETAPELPMAPKILYALGLWLAEVLSLKKPYIGMRIPVAACYGLSLLILYLLAGKYYARIGAILSALCYMAIPRVFGHAHIAGTETILNLFCLLMTYSFVMGLDRWPWSVVCAIAFGLALATKINAIFFPFPLLLWAHIFQRRLYANNIFAMIFVAPAVMFAIWPWLWPEPVARLTSYLNFFVTHKGIPVQYFGVVYPYFNGVKAVNTPSSYPFILTVFTTPLLVLALALLGLARTVANLKKHDIGVLYLLQALAPLCLAALPFAPKYDGVRLFLPAFPFLALLAGIGGEGLAASIRGPDAVERRYGPAQFFATVLSVLVLGYGVIAISAWHPHELSHWNILTGGLPGAYKAKMETTYWGESANEEVYAYLCDLPDGTQVRPLALHDLCFRLLQEWEVIPRGLRIDERPPGDVILLQAREGFFGAEERWLYEMRDQIGQVLVQRRGIPFLIAYDLRNKPDVAAALLRLFPCGPPAAAPRPPEPGAAGEAGASASSEVKLAHTATPCATTEEES